MYEALRSSGGRHAVEHEVRAKDMFEIRSIQ